ncbi:VCBS repeat-containing protein [uncultured Algibacter sp.]|uniref:VCBS repeat-containing protein n=1 Tax=uncultured Algibacter sp. TaxID=298659 RepID=UPI002613AF13|nr:VCBS repeat-containing protein [uncultured Algibacter sp.]
MQIVKSYALILLIFLTFTTLNSCKDSKNNSEKIEELNSKEDVPKLFSKLTPEKTNILFQNELTENIDFNYYQYMYSYIGAGVASGDFNNDGLIDLFFTSNTSACKLYKNEGNLVFQDVSALTSINPLEGFNTGITLVDINQDGLLDIYLVRGGLDKTEGRFENLLYINEGDFQFSEQGAAYGLNDSNRGIQATFFDMDNDNDLDLFISNTPDIDGKTKDVIDLNKKQKDPESQKLLGSDKLYKNAGNGRFVDVSFDSGIHYDIGFGLNPQVGDLNGDGFLDIYVCNDFKVPDFAYINNGDGTFKDQRDTFFKHISYNSMGSDIADFNNDGEFDIATLDMNPEDYIRSKTTMAMTSIPKFEQMVENNYHYQFMHNMLQINNGNSTFSDIGNMSGISNTDWSWAILSADLDLDGYQDLYITNGVFRDVIDQDKTREILKTIRAKGKKPTKEDFLKYAQMFPQQKLKNYFYKNNGDLTFEDVTNKWTNISPTFSNGAIYVDLDNDGDLEVVTNNINESATVLKNNALEQGIGNYVSFNLMGPEGNKNGLGTKIVLETENGLKLTRQLINSRGFLSSVSNSLHFGIPKTDKVKQVFVKWLDGKEQLLEGLTINSEYTISYQDATISKNTNNKELEGVFKAEPFPYGHKDPYHNDYKLQLLLPYKYSHLGPATAIGDINNDGLEDVFIGGAFDNTSELLLGDKTGRFIKKTSKALQDDSRFEDISATFFDADNDGDQDLYVGSGSYEFSPNSRGQQDRLYLNDGNGNFTKSENLLPQFTVVSTVVKAADFDNDGDQDLFIGGGVLPGKYPKSGGSYLLENKAGVFSIANTDFKLPELGMVKDALWEDIDDNGTLDLIVTGEWMGIEVLLNRNDHFEKSKQYTSLSNSKGWWNKLLIEDIDDDGDLDIVAGNLGLNMKFHASNEKPFHVYSKDFDSNGVEDIILSKEYKGKLVPVRGRTCTSQQMPHIAKKIPTFEEFANLGVEGILGEEINSALHYEVNEFRSGIFVNQNGKFEFHPFSNETQASLINSIIYHDFDQDGQKDLLLAGNNYQFEVETTRSDAGIGVFLKGKDGGKFDYIPNKISGFYTDGDVRHLINLPNQKKVIVTVNDGKYLSFNY